MTRHSQPKQQPISNDRWITIGILGGAGVMIAGLLVWVALSGRKSSAVTAVETPTTIVNHITPAQVGNDRHVDGPALAAQVSRGEVPSNYVPERVASTYVAYQGADLSGRYWHLEDALMGVAQRRDLDRQGMISAFLTIQSLEMKMNPTCLTLNNNPPREQFTVMGFFSYPIQPAFSEDHLNVTNIGLLFVDATTGENPPIYIWLSRKWVMPDGVLRLLGEGKSVTGVAELSVVQYAYNRTFMSTRIEFIADPSAKAIDERHAPVRTAP